MNVGEYGIALQFGTGFDMSSQTSLHIQFTKPNGTVLTVVGTLGTILSAPFSANQYVKYTFVNGDIDQAGSYQVRAIYDDGLPSHLISDIGTFVVGA